MDLLSIDELAEVIDRSKNTIYKNFRLLKNNLAKKGVYIERYGTGDMAKYTVTYGKGEKNNE